MEPRGWGVERAAWGAAGAHVAAAASVPISLSSLPVELSEPKFQTKPLDGGKELDNFELRAAGGHYGLGLNEFSIRRSVLLRSR